MRSLRWFFVIVLLISMTPVISIGAGEAVARYAGCQIAEIGFGKCLIHGQDANDMLASLQSIAWLAIWGVPVAGGIVLLWAIIELHQRILGRDTRSLRF